MPEADAVSVSGSRSPRALASDTFDSARSLAGSAAAKARKARTSLVETLDTSPTIGRIKVNVDTLYIRTLGKGGALLPPGAELSDEGAEVPPEPKSSLVGVYVATLLLLAISIGMVVTMNSTGHAELLEWLTPLRAWFDDQSREAAQAEAAAPICEDGLFVPGPRSTRTNAAIYTALLLWSFVGVAIAADIFMVGIEVITSSEVSKVVEVKGVKRTFTVSVWNATVANLTLMALGSSAPEILLSVIEITTSGFFAGELGPSTIVGSAAFNLLVISAVCIVSIPAGQQRFIKDTTVFYITASFSVFAYLWLVVILQVITPNVVDVWEGLLTFAFFPVLVILAYLADTGAFQPDGACGKAFCGLCRPKRKATTAAAELASAADEDKEAKAAINKLLAISADHHLPREEREAALAKATAALKDSLPAKCSKKSRAYYRVSATRSGIGGVVVTSEKRAEEEAEAPPAKAGLLDSLLPKPGKSRVHFSHPGICVLENVGTASVKVVRTGSLLSSVSVKYYTEDGTATAGSDYTAVSGELSFLPGQSFATIKVPILEDDVVEGKETFYVHIAAPEAGNVVLGEASTCEVTIQDNDMPAELVFEQEWVNVKESEATAVVHVHRRGSSLGTVGCAFTTKEGSATEYVEGVGGDFVPTSGTLTFGPGVTRKEVAVTIVDDGAMERDEVFQVILSDPTGGAVFDAATDGGAERALCNVKIVNDDERAGLLSAMTAELVDVDSFKLAGSSWGEQIKDSVRYEGGASCAAALLYALSLPFKMVVAFVPPPRMCGGWACFVVTLGLIGALTALIGDLAGHVGCCLGLLPAVTAITFVAMGTSLPDTFASKQAAVNEDYADNSIGNITGSNSVNVFLGLGMPWAIAALYWRYCQTDETVAEWRARYRTEPWYTESMPVGFAVPAGDLGFSVTVFAVCACTCLGSIILRRAVVGMELGGPPCSKYFAATFFVLLWLAYVALSAASSYGFLSAGP